MSGGAPTVAICIPCHNAARWLGDAIRSALAQDSAIRTEVIVADDGSTDESAAIAESFGPAVRVLRLPHRGGNVARNAAWQAARSEWLQFLDADDYLEPDKLARQLAEAGDLTGIDLLYSPVFEETWRNGAVVSRQAMPLDATADLFTQWIRWHLPQTGGALWRTEALRRIGGWDEAMRCCQEHELYLRALQEGLRWKYCPAPGAVYRIWSETTLCRKDPVRVIKKRTVLIDRLLAWLEENGRLAEAHRTAAGQAFFEMARTWARADLQQAVDYQRERRSRGCWQLRGPAAPLAYRLALCLLGFRGAETLARCTRRPSALV